MRVLHVITALGTGGAESMLLKLLQSPALSRMQQQVLTLLPGGTLAGACRATGARVDELDLLGGIPVLGGSARLSGIARQAAPDLVQGWLYHGNLGGLLARAVQRRQVPLVWGVRQSLPGLQGENAWARAAIRANRWLSGQPDCIVFNSRTSIDQHRAFGFVDTRMRLLPNGFDGERFRPDAAARARMRQEWGFNEAQVVFGTVARLHPVKGHAELLRAARQVLDQRPQARFVLAGPGTGATEAGLSTQVNELGLGPYLRLLGDRRDVPAVLNGLDVYASASRAEAFSNSIGEALCCGLPCVATAVGESPGLVDQAGLVVPAMDPQAMASAMVALCDLDPGRRQQLGAAGRARMLRDFGLDGVAARFGELWLELAAAPARSRATG